MYMRSSDLLDNLIHNNYPKEYGQRKKYFFIPYWIDKRLKQEKLSYDDIFDTATIRNKLSMEDVSSLFALNLAAYYTNEGNLFFSGYKFDQFKHLFNNNLNTNVNDQYIQDIIINSNIIGKKVLEERLFIEDKIELSGYPINEAIKCKGYDIKDVGKDCAFVILYPGYFNNKSTYGHQLAYDLLKLLYVYNDLESVVKSGEFNRYYDLVW